MRSLSTRVKVAGGALLVLVVVVALTAACLSRHRAARSRPPTRRVPVAGLGSADLRLSAPPKGAHRLLLDEVALDRLSRSAEDETEAFRFVLARANEALATTIDSGYQGFEWADAVANLSLAWHATGESRFAEGAIRYLSALLDDRLAVGDGKGGADVVRHDSGYGIRTFGAYSALGYDWLRGAPGMDAALRARILERLGQWLSWYETDGYLRDHPISNYYWGYLTTLSFAGLAASGESEAADGWLREARDALARDVLPAFRDELAGGGWPEGWQYGEYTTLEIALVARAFATGAGIDVTRKLPWLSRVVPHHVHALLPDGRSVYDGGTWGEHPAAPSALALAGVSVALEGIDDVGVAEARWMMAHALPPLRREQAWAGLLAEVPGGKQKDPRKGASASLTLSGQGLSFMRSDWSPSAVWVSFQAGPFIAEDHQHADQGHFELWRGSDDLLIDGGDSEGSATINHNTLLVDDGGRHLNYPPNQGVWGAKVRTTRFADDGAVTVVVGDIGEAYAPKCAEDGCDDRSVEQAVRTLVFVRPSTVVIDDRVVLERPEYDVRWAAHLRKSPTITGSLASAVVGGSRVDVRTLEPQGARGVSLSEPTPSGEGSHRADSPRRPMWRLEVPSRRGARERGFLHFITVDRAKGAAPASRRLSGKGLRGCVGRVSGRRIAVLFADADSGGEIALGEGADLVVIAGLEPGHRYQVALDPASGCQLTLSPTEDGSALEATVGGFVRIGAKACGAP